MSVDFIMAMSCAPPALVGAYYYGKVEKKYRPFIITLFLSLFTELFSRLVIILYLKKRCSFTPYYIGANIYLLVNVILFYIFFERVNCTGKKSVRFLQLLFMTVVLTSLLVNRPYNSFPLILNILFSVFILAMSVKLLSMQVFEMKIKLLKNPLFYISAGCIIFYTYQVFSTILTATLPAETELHWYFVLAEKMSNVLHYVLFLVAILWMSKKK